MDLAATPGIKIRILNCAEHLDQLTQKYGPIYFKLPIPKTTYTQMDADVQVACVANLLICNEKMDATLVYNILKALLDHKPELVAVHQEAKNLTLATATVGSPLPFTREPLNISRRKESRSNRLRQSRPGFFRKSIVYPLPRKGETLCFLVKGFPVS